MSKETLSVCLTNFNREKLLYESIEQVIDDERISEIIISDDCSDYELYKRVVEYYKAWPKVKVSRNDTNVDCFRNKRKAVSLASNEFVILFDSDNILTKSYIDKLFHFEWDKHVIFQPVFAKPKFNFKEYSGLKITSKNVARHIEFVTFGTMLNAMNYFVNRDEYLRVWNGDVDPVTSDSLYQNHQWLSHGNSIYVVPGLEYEHRVEDHGKEEKSHYVKNVKRTKSGFHQSIIDKLKKLK